MKKEMESSEEIRERERDREREQDRGSKKNILKTTKKERTETEDPGLKVIA